MLIVGNAHTVERGGKRYIRIGEGTVTNRIHSFRGYAHYNNNVSRYVYGLFDTAVNTTWRMLKPFIDPIINRFIHETMEETAEQILNDTPIDYFLIMDPALPTIPN